MDAVISLVRHELKRNLRPVVVLPVLGFFVILIYDEIHDPWVAGMAQVQGALTLHRDALFFPVIFVAGVVGSSLADEQRRGIALMSLSRGVTRSRYVLAKALGAAASGALLTAAGIACFYVLVAIRWPWGRVDVELHAPLAGPVPALFRWSPLANDLLGASMIVAEGAALSTVAVLASTLTSNRYLVMATPLLLVLAGAVLNEEGVWAPGLPIIYLTLSGTYVHAIPAALQPFAAFLYWAVFAVIFTAAARWIFARRELT